MYASKAMSKKKVFYSISILSIIACILIIIFAILDGSNIALYIGIGLPITILINVFDYFIVKNINENYKQLAVQYAFLRLKMDYFFGKDTIKPNKIPYNMEINEFLRLRVVEEKENATYKTNNLLVGERKFADFRSVDITYDSYKAHIIALRLQADKELSLYICDNNYTKPDNYKEIKLDTKKRFTFFTNNEEKALRYLKPNLCDSLPSLIFEDNILITICDGSLYIIKNNSQNDYSSFVEEKDDNLDKAIAKEMDFIEKIIDLFKFERAKPKVKELKIK